MPEVVDLTESVSASDVPGSGVKRKRSSDSEGDMSKKQYGPDQESAITDKRSSKDLEDSVETAVRRIKIGAMSCIICMESYTNATVAHCGMSSTSWCGNDID